MGTSSWYKWPAALALLSILLAFAVVRSVGSAATKNQFLRLREAVYQQLQERAVGSLEGVTIVLPPDEESRKRIAVAFPDKAFINATLSRRDWIGGGGFQLLLDLGDAALQKDKQTSSDTMTATKLLNHYFSHLAELGLHTHGSPGVVGGKIQSATNEWFHEPDDFISVEGTVFVAPEARQGIVICRLRERLAKQ